MPNEIKEVSQDQAKSKSWNLDSDRENQAKIDEIQQQLRDNTEERKKNEAEIARLKQNIQTAKDETNLAIELQLTELREQYRKILTPDKTKAEPASRPDLSSSIMRQFYRSKQKKKATRTTGSVIFNNEAIKKITKNSEKHKKIIYKMMSNLQQLRSKVPNTVSAYQSEIDKLTSSNKNLAAKRRELMTAERQLNRLMTQDDFFRLPKDQFFKAVELGNIITPSVSMLKKLSLIQLSILMNTPFSITLRSNKPKTVLQQMGERLMSTFHKIKSAFNIGDPLEPSLKPPKELDPIKTSIKLNKWSSQVTQSISEIMTTDLENYKELKTLKLSEHQLEMKKNELALAAKKRKSILKKMFTSWKESIGPELLADLQAFTDTGNTSIQHVKQPFVLLLSTNGDAASLFFPLINDVISILVPLRNEETKVDKLSRKQFNALKEKFEILKTQIEFPKQNKVIQQIESLFLLAKENISEREILDEKCARNAELQRNITVHYHPGKRKQINRMNKSKPDSTSEMLSAIGAEPLAVPPVEETAKKKRVKFAEGSSISSTLGFIKGFSTTQEPSMKNAIPRHYRSRTGG